MISLSATYQHDDKKTWEEIKANGDAAIVGVGHCSNCAPAVATHAITIETKYGVPTVALHTDKFDRVVQSVTKMAGLPEAQRAFVPMPVMGKTARGAARLRLRQGPDHREAGHAGGHRGAHHRAERLRNMSEHASKAEFERTTPRLVEPDTEENLQRQFHENGWTDFLPIVLPTEKRVQEMLAYTSRKPDEIVGHMAATEFRVAWEYTVEKVAVNAVMAGAQAGILPGHPGARGIRRLRARLDHLVIGGDGGGERPDPQRAQDELRHRRDGPLQSRQRHHRPRLRPALAEPAGRLGAGRQLHGLAGQQLHI